jgi:hypothetical protein
MTDRELMQLAMETIQGCRPSSKSYKQMRETVEALRDRLAQSESDCKSDFDLLFKANSADIEALTDAQFTLEAIKSADPGTHDEIIDASLRLIKVALSKSVFGPLESIAGRIGVEL